MTDIRQLLADAAIERDAARNRAEQYAADTLRVLPSERVHYILDLGDGTVVAEIHCNSGSFPITYGVIVNGDRVHVRGRTVEEGLLIAIAARNGIRDNDLQATAAAAGRALGYSPE